jgi:opacity protein-like surface antigen
MKKLCITLFALATALAGADPSVRPGTIEITGFGGVNMRLPGANAGALSEQLLGIYPPTTGLNQTFPAFGGAIGLAMSHRVMLTGEFMYTPLGAGNFTTVVTQQTLSAQETSRQYQLMAGLQYLFRTESSRLAPYIGFGLGASEKAERLTLGLPAGMVGTATTATQDQAKIAGNVAAGLRFHITDSFGVRPEFRVMRIPGLTYFRADAGVFYQFRK